jgi:hypothetical protein
VEDEDGVDLFRLVAGVLLQRLEDSAAPNDVPALPRFYVASLKFGIGFNRKQNRRSRIKHYNMRIRFPG